MKRWKKVLLTVLAVILLAPWFWAFFSDGGSYTFGSPLYQVRQYHYMDGQDEGYWVGTSISLFGVEIYCSPMRHVQE